MIKSRSPVDDVRHQEERAAYHGLGYEGALDVFLALWSEARLLNPELGADWLDDVQCDIAVARTLNGLAPAV
jgi:hypothetical protein